MTTLWCRLLGHDWKDISVLAGRRMSQCRRCQTNARGITRRDK